MTGTEQEYQTIFRFAKAVFSNKEQVYFYQIFHNKNVYTFWNVFIQDWKTLNTVKRKLTGFKYDYFRKNVRVFACEDPSIYIQQYNQKILNKSGYDECIFDNYFKYTFQNEIVFIGGDHKVLKAILMHEKEGTLYVDTYFNAKDPDAALLMAVEKLEELDFRPMQKEKNELTDLFRTVYRREEV